MGTGTLERVDSARPIRELPPEVARKIAAGEVIDRPAAVVRELIDNAIDSGASKITVEIEEGGVASLRVSDNGRGMTKEDLAICARPHTTSKIATEDDLLSLSTLGFRGEALSSIAAVSRLSIVTTRDGREAWELSGSDLTRARLAAGTTVGITDLFGNFPARRQFLKRQSAETSQCRQVFTEKALAWPEIEFRLVTDGTARMVLPAEQTYLARALAALSPKEPESFFYEISNSAEGFSFSIALGSPEVARADRRDLMIFVNGRRIIEYSLVQAIEYGCEGHFPNGAHPFALLFVAIDPSLVDFNIHPAKREARFRDSGALHHAVSSTIRDFFRHYGVANEAREQNPHASEFSYRETADHSTDVAYAARAAYAAASPQALYAAARTSANDEKTMPKLHEGSSGFRILGQTLGTFIAVERDDALYLIDQHAAHERILYNDLMAAVGGAQELLVPYRIETSSRDEDARLERVIDELRAAGFALESSGDGSWIVTSVPARWSGTEADMREDILSARSGAEALVSRIYASAACRAACKEGDVLDDETARSIVERAFALPDPVCPHGRPVWVKVDRDELYRRIRRT